MDEKLDIPIDGGKVIHLSVVRPDRTFHQLSQACSHVNVQIDPTLTLLHCNDCKKDVNPVAWILMLTGHWSHVQRQHQRLKDAMVLYDAKQRCRCEHCNKITKVRPATAAEVREFKKRASASGTALPGEKP